MLFIIAIGVSIACIYIGVSKSNEYIFLKSNLSNLHECLIEIHLHKRIEEWAVVSLTKLPTEINACIGGFLQTPKILKKRFSKKDKMSSSPHNQH
jgi:hypothetical protein